ncbi:helix-turn-helix transcriptional regulator [Nocardia seriolae]|uniref:DNA-binding protein n=1 Tax=Nocardia seriolae TaxID=37332 RepID=A0ABC9Z4P1_9NOCA|nr:helix-turn-helix transcriptional regulator [Nocardia seriolae]BEK98914.1 LuxR C-terminal-related transcriptional regulator [Nocardia seriolae]GAM50810.1 DNA-binding protein [Nocardia seriolae]GAP32779.1 DNA-binding protein [Nocardia seriolae]
MASPEGLTSAVERICRTVSGAVAIECAIADLLRASIGFDAWCAITLDPASLLPTGGYHEQGVPFELASRLLEIEVRGGDAMTWPAMIRAGERVATLDRATGGDRELSQRYREVLVPAGMGHELRATFTTPSGIWGALVLLRSADSRDFTAADMRAIEESTAGVATALRREMVLTDIAKADSIDGPGLVMLDDSMSMIDATRAGLMWLSEFDDSTDPLRQLPVALTMIAHRVQASAMPVRTRVRTRTGRWLTLHADRLTDAPQCISVIIEPARPVEIAELIADAYGLTPREREVVRLLSGGCTRQEIARALALSAHTVDDHVKRIFGTLEVRSRAELAAKLFHDQHAPRLAAEVPVGASGWFIR